MELKLSFCEFSWEAVVCKVALTEEQRDKANAVIKENPCDMFEIDEELYNPVAEIEIRGVNCISFIEEDKLIMSIRLDRHIMLDISGEDVFADEGLLKSVLDRTWMLFVPHLKKFI